MNAFSLPGGHVFVGEGLLDFMNSEDQLAFILGHGLEHIDHYHCAERVQIEAHFRKLRLGIMATARTKNWKQTAKDCGCQCLVDIRPTGSQSVPEV
jgi:predicted Zn-dependent protease